MINFLNDPLGEMPWEEEDGTEDVRHVNTNMVGKSIRLCSKEIKENPCQCSRPVESYDLSEKTNIFWSHESKS